MAYAREMGCNRACCFRNFTRKVPNTMRKVLVQTMQRLDTIPIANTTC